MLSDRKCTDIIFAFVIVVVLVAYIGIAVFAYINGNISSLFIPLNSKGDECGGEKYPEKPNLLIFDYSNINLLQTAFSLISSKKFMISAKSKCVKSCPEDFGVPTVKNNICDDGIVISDDRNLLTQIKNKNCAPVNIPTIELLKYCVPDVEKISTSIIDIAKDVKFGDIFLTFEQLTKISSAFSKLSEYKIVNIFRNV
uniref:Choline transporter-like protein 5 (Trinotate prediction) n=1 Tax=Henneguya salminicola TaxID=69463 RepID=A0A6G3MG36_HENSL